MKLRATVSLAFMVFSLAASLPAAQEAKILYGFEQPAELKAWEFKKGSAALVGQHITQGAKALKISSDEYFITFRKMDWSGFESLDIDMFVDGDDPIGGSLLIADEAWNKKKDYWNRHNGSFNLKPGANTVSIPVNGLFRGEAGSRGNDLKTNVDPSAIIRMDIGFKSKGKPASIYIDHMRLTKESLPAGILAFDFGPKSQVVFPGFTPVSFDTVHGKDGAKAGLKQPRPSAYQARDDLFPSRLYQDCVVLDWSEFIVDVPDGKYSVWVVFNDCGYWGGEQARFSKRWIDAEGLRAWTEDRGEDGPTDYLFRFENVEPKPGDSIWDLYVSYLFTPKRFQTAVKDGQLNLRFAAEGPNGCKVAAIIIYPEERKADAEKWAAEVEARNRKEFESRALYTGPKAAANPPGNAITPENPTNTSGDFTYAFPGLEQDVPFGSIGGSGALHRTAARGQFVSCTFAATAKTGGTAKLSATDLKGPGGTIPSSEIDLRYVQYATHRGFNDIAYTLAPESLRRVPNSGLLLSMGSPRQFWITVHVPAQAKPGIYSGQVVLLSGANELKLSLSVEVLDLTLDEPDFMMGFFGVHVPQDLPAERRKTALRELCLVMKQYGMNSFSGGPSIKFSGFDAAGKPQLDFSACDEFFKTVKECGFSKPLVAYGGPGMVTGLHDSYVVGDTGRGWEKKTGKPFGELLKIVWTAVKEHADNAAWPKIYYEFTDEPRVIEQAQKQIELMKLYREHAPFVYIGGSYSVHWGEKEFDKAIQKMFKTLAWSSLNLHTQTDLDKAREFGREVQIYNQGTTRYSFGAYQWAEFRKGVTGRMQWHLLALHGYQFFDLDGREPDTAMINWGRREIIPTLKLARCREGADDFRFAVTLWNLAEKHKELPASKAAKAWLDEVNKTIGINQNKRPEGFMNDETFRQHCIEHIKAIQAAR